MTDEEIKRMLLIADMNGGGVCGRDAENVADILLARGWKHD